MMSLLRKAGSRQNGLEALSYRVSCRLLNQEHSLFERPKRQTQIKTWIFGFRKIGKPMRFCSPNGGI
jgi:hypothetical protein